MPAPRYQATKSPQGTWTILDVPVFSAHKRTLPSGKEFAVDAAWLGKALTWAQTREGEGYLPPLHVSHHDAGQPVQAAGKIRFRRVGTQKVGGQDVPTIFADLLEVPDQVYQEIRRGRLSYRSAEILDVSKPEIDSLALLDHEVPFFRYPLLRVAEGEDVTFSRRPQGEPALAYRAAGSACAVLFHYAQGGDMDDDEKKPEGADSAAGGPMAKIKALLMQVIEAIDEAEGGDPEGDEAPAQPAPPVQSGAGPIEMAAAAPASQPATFAAPASAPVATQAVAAANTEGQLYAMQTRLTAMEAQLESERRALRVEAKANELRAHGRSAADIATYRAQVKKHGEEVAAGFAAGMLAAGPSTPHDNWTGEMRAEAFDPPEVLAYQAKGPEALEQARSIAASHKRAGSTLPLAQFISANWEA